MPQEGVNAGFIQLGTLRRLREELNYLFLNTVLKGKIRVTAINLPHEIEIVLKVASKNIYSSEKQVHLIFMFGHKYPEEPPLVKERSNYFNGNSNDRNLIDEENWAPKTTLSQIIIEIYRRNQEKGANQFLFSSSSQKQSTKSTVSQVFYFPITNDRLQNQNQFSKYLTSNSAFKPLQYQVAESSYLEQISEINQVQQEDIREIKSITITNSSKKQKSIKKEAKPMNKNANLPKFLIRIFIKYIDQFRNLYQKKQFDRLMHQCKKMKEWKRSDKKQHAFGLKHLKRFFQSEENGYPNPKMNRKVIMDIIEKFLLEQICSNSQIPENHKVGYLSACRVYSIRCRNSILAGRIQSK